MSNGNGKSQKIYLLVARAIERRTIVAHIDIAADELECRVKAGKYLEQAFSSRVEIKNCQELFLDTWKKLALSALCVTEESVKRSLFLMLLKVPSIVDGKQSFLFLPDLEVGVTPLDAKTKAVSYLDEIAPDNKPNNVDCVVSVTQIPDRVITNVSLAVMNEFRKFRA